MVVAHALVDGGEDARDRGDRIVAEGRGEGDRQVAMGQRRALSEERRDGVQTLLRSALYRSSMASSASANPIRESTPCSE